MTSILFLCVVAATLICGCTSDASGSPGATDDETATVQSTVIITDMIGREVEIPASVNSVIPIAQGTTRVFSYLGATDVISGISETENKSFSKYPYLAAHPELKKLPIVDAGGAGDPYFEEIVKVSPDLIVASYIDTENANHIQEKTGIPVIVIKPGVGRIGFMDYTDDNNDLFTSLDLIASVIGEEERSEELKLYIKSLVNDLEGRTSDVAEDKKVSVYVGGLSKQGAFGLASTQVKYPPFIWVNADNVASGVKSASNTIEISKEQIIGWNPAIIFADMSNIGLIKDELRSGLYDDIDAVKDDRIYGVLPYPGYGLNHELVLSDSYYVGSVLYPERFVDIDVVSKTDEIIKQFNGKESYSAITKKTGGFGRIEEF
ncbi:ABC transporter substrate-binding protein [Methanoplanus limicola]|uniref:ABC transporter substrate-binding protein n=1 Tax=Methanoplanus limicola TaxID=2315 RepID=UPI001FE0F260|nr:ABC transporter substrate-binding protein [Methanoplanus limicola]